MSNLRFLAASDIHGDTKMVERFARSAIDFAASGLILVGDIGPTVKKVASILAQLRLPIYAVLGNDDLLVEEDTLDQVSYVLNIHGECIDIGPVEIVGLNGLCILGSSRPDEDKIQSVLQKAFSKAKKPVILASHLPPYGTLDLATFHGTGHIGSRSVRRAIEKYKPVLCLCGHVHKDGGKRELLGFTEVVNIAGLADDPVSKSQSRRFALLDIDEKRKCCVSFDYLIDVDLPIEKFIQKYV